jgi:hypothetical protein
VTKWEKSHYAYLSGDTNDNKIFLKVSDITNAINGSAHYYIL